MLRLYIFKWLMARSKWKFLILFFYRALPIFNRPCITTYVCSKQHHLISLSAIALNGILYTQFIVSGNYWPTQHLIIHLLILFSFATNWPTYLYIVIYNWFESFKSYMANSWELIEFVMKKNINRKKQEINIPMKFWVFQMKCTSRLKIFSFVFCWKKRFTLCNYFVQEKPYLGNCNPFAKIHFLI